FYHDGRFATLLDVVNHYDTFFGLGLTEGEKQDLIQYLLSLGDDVAPNARNASTLNLGAEGAAGEVRPNPWRLGVAPIPATGGGGLGRLQGGSQGRAPLGVGAQDQHLPELTFPNARGALDLVDRGPGAQQKVPVLFGDRVRVALHVTKQDGGVLARAQ